MKTDKEISRFLMSLQWRRLTKAELEVILSDFFQTEMKLTDCTDYKNTETDYIFSTNTDSVDIDIYYLKMRDNERMIVTETNFTDLFN